MKGYMSNPIGVASWKPLLKNLHLNMICVSVEVFKVSIYVQYKKEILLYGTISEGNFIKMFCNTKGAYYHQHHRL